MRPVCNIENEYDLNKGGHHVAMKRGDSDSDTESTRPDPASGPQPYSEVVEKVMAWENQMNAWIAECKAMNAECKRLG